MSEALRHYTNEFRSKRDVSPYDAEVFFDALIAETDQDVLTALLEAWTDKGTTEDELYRFASIMRGRMRPLRHSHETVVDIVGTGGSSAKTFNVSTAAAFVIAGTGLAVAKHGNRAATSSSGSADVLSELGLDVDVEPEMTEADLADHGLCFMFAPRFHSLSPTLAAARRALGRPTIFNNLGPICNPASVPHQIVGVYNPQLLERTARVLARLGTTRSWVVSGHGGLDEISLAGPTKTAEISNGVVTISEIGPADFGINSIEGRVPQNCSPRESADAIEAILSNGSAGSDAEKLVLMNAAAAIFVSTHAKTLPEAFGLAQQSVRDSKALDKFKSLRARR
jgi:anthranilate phosphoribosyltransferase